MMTSGKQIKVVRKEQIEAAQSLFNKMGNWRYAVEKLGKNFVK
jgi:hypothetical protein